MSLPYDPDEVTLPQRGMDYGPSPRGDAREAVRADLNEGRHEAYAGGADPQRELTLSTGTILAIFFALALVCAVFFGFGYQMGHKSAQAAAQDAIAKAQAAAAASKALAAEDGNGSDKPSASSPVIPGYAPDAAKSKVAVVVKTQSPEKPPVTPAKPLPLAPSKSVSTAAAIPAPSAPMPQASNSGTIYVQVAAVSHQEDANTLLKDLRRRGYAVFTRQPDGDSLIHVQVGPFASKKDAETMRSRLQGDGYNAILK